MYKCQEGLVCICHDRRPLHRPTQWPHLLYKCQEGLFITDIDYLHSQTHTYTVSLYSLHAGIVQIDTGEIGSLQAQPLETPGGPRGEADKSLPNSVLTSFSPPPLPLCLCFHPQTHTHTCTHARTHTNTQTHAHAYTHAHTHTHTHKHKHTFTFRSHGSSSSTPGLSSVSLNKAR